MNFNSEFKNDEYSWEYHYHGNGKCTELVNVEGEPIYIPLCSCVRLLIALSTTINVRHQQSREIVAYAK